MKLAQGWLYYRGLPVLGPHPTLRCSFRSRALASDLVIASPLDLAQRLAVFSLDQFKLDASGSQRLRRTMWHGIPRTPFRLPLL